jgi:hypothetical protein
MEDLLILRIDALFVYFGSIFLSCADVQSPTTPQLANCSGTNVSHDHLLVLKALAAISPYFMLPYRLTD